jgi:hypothetical protein
VIAEHLARVATHVASVAKHVASVGMHFTSAAKERRKHRHNHRGIAKT